MDRALNLALLGGALDGIGNLPTPAELRRMLADAEVEAFFAGDHAFDSEVVETAWTLHQVGTVRPQLELYTQEQQVQANAVAAHIFDLALRNGDLDLGARLVITFAAQVSYVRGDRTPNATALWRRLPPAAADLNAEPGLTSLELGCTMLGLDRRSIVGLLRALDPALQAHQARFSQGDASSYRAAAAGVVRGCRLLEQYLTNGNGDALSGARDEFIRAANARGALRDLDSRWVAANLLDLCDDLGRSSVWAILPAGSPPAAARAMTVGDPPVMALWPPQIALLSDEEHNPLRPEVKRAVLTYPTSAGKTLLTQFVVAHHLATASTNVCVVAPSHSLCREIRSGLDNRLWLLKARAIEDGPLGDRGARRGRVVVMTPEKLAARLRAGEGQLLDDFGLFVLDEAHLVADTSRGWTFETTVARLHQLTEHTDHRIVLVSAAMGGTASVQSWLNAGDAPATAAAKWRGPRRLHATYTTRLVGPKTTTPPVPPKKLPRTTQTLRGVVDLYVDKGQAVATRSTPLGDVVTAGSSTTKPSRAEQLTPIVQLAAQSGPVLTVHATKRSAENLAKELAARRPVKPEAAQLRRLASLRLDPRHPLVGIIDKGVAYHHAALPADVQAEIEVTARDGALDIVCATTTLTDGLNLPVRTVIVCDQGFQTKEGFVRLIEPADLLNAAGRAGRAGRETEGWVVVAEEPGRKNPRADLRALDEDQDIHSTLNSADALAALGEYEALLTTTLGLVLTNVPAEVDSFLSFCWYLADSAVVLDGEARVAAVIDGVRHTLAWHQLPDDVKARWEAIAAAVADSYEAAPPQRRTRWAKTGTPLSANAVLEDVTTTAIPALQALDYVERWDVIALLDALLGDGGLARLLTLVPERVRRFKKRRFGPTQLIAVDFAALVLDWVRGRDLGTLATTYLAGVEGDDDGFRFEQLSAFLTSVCEHHLPWTLSTIVEWIEADTAMELSPNLPASVHFGVADPIALEMMKRGVRSRRLAVSVSEHARGAGIEVDDLRSWLSHLGAAGWRDRFEAGTTEVADLLQFLHDLTTGTSAALLDGDAVRFAVPTPADGVRRGEPLAIGPLPNEERPRPLVAVAQDGSTAALIPPSHHQALATLLDAGYRLTAELDKSSDGTAELTVRLLED